MSTREAAAGELQLPERPESGPTREPNPNFANGRRPTFADIQRETPTLAKFAMRAVLRRRRALREREQQEAIVNGPQS